MKQKLLFVLVLMCAAAIALLTLASVELRPHLFAHPSEDRIFAFAVLGALLAFALPRHMIGVLVWLMIVAVATEALQSYRPGRDPRLPDAAAKIFGAVLGVALASVLQKLFGPRPRLP